MKRKVLCLFLALMPFAGWSQNLAWVAFDTNGPMGECLFPMNDKGEIVYTDIIPCALSADTIMGLAKEFMYDIGKRYNATCKIELEGVTKLACKVMIPIGKEYFSIGDIATWERSHSEVSFDLLIEIRPKKYRYTLNNFYTQRRRIPGEGKNDGPSNLIHWQRVNSLTKETPRKGKNREEYLRMIEDEKTTYQAEYNAVQGFLKDLRTFAEIKEDF